MIRKVRGERETDFKSFQEMGTALKHLRTISLHEYDVLVEIGWNGEGIAFYAELPE